MGNTSSILATFMAVCVALGGCANPDTDADTVHFDAYEAFMDDTGNTVPWHVLDASRRKGEVRDALKLLTELIDKGLKEGRYVGGPFDEDFPLKAMPRLSEVDLSHTLDDDDETAATFDVGGRVYISPVENLEITAFGMVDLAIQDNEDDTALRFGVETVFSF